MRPSLMRLKQEDDMLEANSGYATMPCPETSRSRDIGLGRGDTCAGLKL